MNIKWGQWGWEEEIKKFVYILNKQRVCNWKDEWWSRWGQWVENHGEESINKNW